MKKILSIAKITFIDIARDRIFYSFIVVFFLLFCVSVLASRLSILSPIRIIIDFGNSVLLIGLSLFSILQSAAMIAREYERRTVLLVQSKPLTSLQFILGKFFGIVGILGVNVLLLFIIESMTLWLFDIKIYASFVLSFFLAWMQCSILSAVAIFFVSFTTVTLAVLFSVGILMLGSTSTEFINHFSTIKAEGLRDTLIFFVYLFPSFEPFNLGYRLTYSFPVSVAQVFWPIFYTISYSGVFLFFSSKFIQKKEY